MSILISLLRGVPHIIEDKYGNRGYETPRPVFVGLARGLVAAALLGAVTGAINFFSSADVPPDLVFLVPAVIVGLRSLEGLIDQIDPKTERGS